jgi:hypothetical protein
VSSVSVGGGDEELGKGDEVDSAAVNATDVDGVTLRCVASSGSPSLYLAGGTILRDGRNIARFHR